ncbi:MAG: hypothetical protein LAO31_06290 [Acidobacteriia bacterium]|nr:hypothetical protein [Terriglobia bacterium]
MSKRLIFAIITIACCFALTACSTVKAPAEAAITAADQALAGVSKEASQYVPDQLKSVQEALAAAKANLQKGEYQQALTGAQDVAAKAKDLAKAVAAKKDELTKAWQDMSSGLPGMVNAIQSRVAILSKSRSLPAGLDKDKFESAKASLATVTQTWTEASNAFQSGNLMDAVGKAKAVKEKAVEIMNALGMKAPAAAM